MVVGSFQSAPLYLLNGVLLPKRGWRSFSTGNATILRRYRHTTISGSGFFIFSARCFWPTALMLPLKWPFTKPLVLYCYLLFLAEHLYQILISSALRVSQATKLYYDECSSVKNISSEDNLFLILNYLYISATTKQQWTACISIPKGCQPNNKTCVQAMHCKISFLVWMNLF